jgi:hypothetical protein
VKNVSFVESSFEIIRLEQIHVDNNCAKYRIGNIASNARKHYTILEQLVYD